MNDPADLSSVERYLVPPLAEATVMLSEPFGQRALPDAAMVLKTGDCLRRHDLVGQAILDIRNRLCEELRRTQGQTVRYSVTIG
jgi:hypothetical protein